jgi:hypothetical protein
MGKSKLKIINVNSIDVKEDVQLLLGLGEGGEGENASVGDSSFTLFHSIVCHESGGKKKFI